jgi:purine-nucleoside phosphorylase
VVSLSAIGSYKLCAARLPASSFPAVPDFMWARRVSDELEKQNCRVWHGLIWTTDGRIVGQYEPARIEKMVRWRVFGIDMETSAFFVVSHMLCVRAASASVIIDIPHIDGRYAPISEDREAKISLGLYRCFRTVPELIRQAAR